MQLQRATGVVPRWHINVAQHCRAQFSVHCNTSWFHRNYFLLGGKEEKLCFPYRWEGRRTSHLPLTLILPTAQQRTFGKFPFQSTRWEVVFAIINCNIPAHAHQSWERHTVTHSLRQYLVKWCTGTCRHSKPSPHLSKAINFSFTKAVS